MKRILNSNLKTTLALIAIILIGFCLRTLGLSWDQGFYLNPDERFLTMVEGVLKLPPSLGQYFNPLTSPLNPYNAGFGFFVYGHFPLSLLKILAVSLDFDTYANFFRLSRIVTAFFDTSVALAIFLVARELFHKEKAWRRLGVYAALIYALLVFPIQQSHFFTTDAFVNAFFVWSFYFSLKSHRGIYWTAFSALCFGLGMASKINIVYALPLILGFLFLNERRHYRKLILTLVVFGLVSYLTLRLADPYIFQSGSWLDPRPSEIFVQNLKQLNSFGKDAFYPPAVQWLDRSFFFALTNIFFFGSGVIFFLLFLGGVWIRAHQRKLVLPLILILLWAVFFYSIQSLQLGKTMRYYYFLYPLIALFAGVTLQALGRVLRVTIFALASLWTFAFMNIYLVSHSRLQASNWLTDNLKNESTIVWEYWDDPLPLYQSPLKTFRHYAVNFYDKDTPEKWQLIANKLRFIDYIILSSNRQHSSLTRVPELYPYASRYYELLMKGKLGFKLVREFHVYPALSLGSFKLELNDQWAEEAFTVYDHPQVLIFKKQKGFSSQRFLQKLNVQ